MGARTLPQIYCKCTDIIQMCDAPVHILHPLAPVVAGLPAAGRRRALGPAVPALVGVQVHEGLDREREDLLFVLGVMF